MKEPRRTIREKRQIVQISGRLKRLKPLVNHCLIDIEWWSKSYCDWGPLILLSGHYNGCLLCWLDTPPYCFAFLSYHNAVRVTAGCAASCLLSPCPQEVTEEIIIIIIPRVHNLRHLLLSCRSILVLTTVSLPLSQTLYCSSNCSVCMSYFLQLLLSF